MTYYKNIIYDPQCVFVYVKLTFELFLVLLGKDVRGGGGVVGGFRWCFWDKPGVCEIGRGDIKV